MSDPAYTIWRGADAVLIRDARGGVAEIPHDALSALRSELTAIQQRKNFRWTAEADAELRRLYADKVMTRDIATALGAPSVGGVAQRIKVLGIASRNPKQQAKMRAAARRVA